MPAECRHSGTNQIDRVEAARQIVRHADGECGAAIVHCRDGGDAGTHALLGFVEQAAQFPGFHPLEDLTGELHAAHVLVGQRRGPTASAEGDLLFRLGQLAFEATAFFDQGGDAALDVLRRGLERGGDRFQRLFAADDPAPRGFARQRLDPAHARADRAFRDDAEQADVAGRAHVRPTAQFDRVVLA